MSSSNSVKIYKRLLHYALQYRLRFLLAIVGMLVFALTEAGFAWLMKPILDGTFIEKDDAVIAWLPYFIVGLFAIRIVAGFFANYNMAWIGRTVIKSLRSELFNKILTLPTRYYDQNASGEIIARFTYNVEQVASATTSVLTTLIRDTVTVIALLGLMFYHSVQLTLFLLITVPILVLMVGGVSRRFRKLSKRIQNSMGDVSHIIEEVTEGHRVVKVFGGYEQEKTNFEKINENNRNQFIKMAATEALASPLVEFVVAIVLAGIILVATSSDNLQSITPGTFMSFIVAMMLLFPSLKRLMSINAQLQKGIAAGESIFETLDMPSEIDTGSKVLKAVESSIRFNQVCFAYNKDSPILKSVNLEICKGETIALVGASGGGKSTLANLLPRFYEVNDGCIEIDGINIQDYSLKSLRNQISYVSQQVTLFNDTIAHNIEYGHPDEHNLKRIKLAAKRANILEFIESLPEGFNTEVGENGVLLSGGQRQRLAIARALLKDAPILILDEATSALDVESERHVQSALESLMQNRTTLVIAHRLSTIENADRIVAIKQGEIIEEGSHIALLEQGGYYAELYKMQFESEA